MDPFSLIQVGIYKRSSTFQSKVLVGLAAVHCDSAEWAASFATEATKDTILRDGFNNVVLKASFRQTLLDTCGETRRATRDILFLLPGY